MRCLFFVFFRGCFCCFPFSQVCLQKTTHNKHQTRRICQNHSQIDPWNLIGRWFFHDDSAQLLLQACSLRVFIVMSQDENISMNLLGFHGILLIIELSWCLQSLHPTRRLASTLNLPTNSSGNQSVSTLFSRNSNRFTFLASFKADFLTKRSNYRILASETLYIP